MGIDPVVHLPAVGMNLSDHPIITLSWRVNSSTTYDDFNRDTAVLNEEIIKWQTTRESPLANGIAQHIGFVRVPDNSSIFANTINPASGPNSPHFEIFVSVRCFARMYQVILRFCFRCSHRTLLGNTPPDGSYLSISAIMLTPGSNSRGSVSLNASFPGSRPNPFQPPIIDAGLLLSATDVPLMREAIRSILRLASAPAWRRYIISPVNPSQPSYSASNAEIESYIRENSRSAYHVVGTASMSPKDGKEGLTDPDLTLKRVSGVRIVDASVLVRHVTYKLDLSSPNFYFCSPLFPQGIHKPLSTLSQNVQQISLKILI